MPRLTKRIVDAIDPLQDKDVVVWDDALPGYGLRVKPSGVKSFIIQYRNLRGASKRVTIGRYGVLTPNEARDNARQMLASVARGDDPAENKSQALREWTVRELCDEYLKQAEAGNILTRRRTAKSPSTLATDRGRITRHIVPLLGRRTVADLQRRDLIKFLQDVKAGKTAVDVKTGHRGRAIVTGGQGTAKRTVGLLSGILGYACEIGLIDKNPAHGLRLPADGKRTITDLAVKYAALGRALSLAADRGEPWQAVDAIWLVALTGMRRSEAVNLRWIEVDFDGRSLRLEKSKTGYNVRPFGRRALDVLRKARDRKSDCDFVFPAARTEGASYGGLPRAWRRIVSDEALSANDRAALADLSLHGLRHGFATTADTLGLTLPTVAALLGHAAGGVTAGYVGRVDAVMTAAADEVAKMVADLMGDGKDGVVVMHPTMTGISA